MDFKPSQNQIVQKTYHPKILSSMKKVFSIIVVAFLPFQILWAQPSKNSVGFSVGQWQPSQLKTESPSSVFSGSADSTPFYSLHFSRHIFGDVGAHLSIGYWAHFFDRDIDPFTLRVVPVHLGVKQSLIDDSIISPYVIYGGGLLFANTIEGEKINKSGPGKLSKTGFEIFLLTGIQTDLISRFGLNLNFGYVVANMPESLGVGVNYSGLRATVGVVYRY